ncbi:MAG: winged helix-turn-helix transcriptional regulator [Candidatus Heimdallarchaeota archaeon]
MTDEIDFLILKKLFENSRLTYRDLADVCDLSVSATHKRIKKLEEDGIIEVYIARPSPIALKYLLVVIFGTSDAKSMDSVSRELGQHENISFVGIAGAKSLYVNIFLRNLSELQELSTYVSKIAKISTPRVGIVNLPYITTPEQLTKIDYKILKTLNKDARKPIVDIADDVGISAKTVKKRIDRMIENNLVTFSIQWKIWYASFITVFRIMLNEGTNISSTIQYLNQKYAKNVYKCISYSNIPNMVTFEILTKHAKESQKIQEELQTEGFKNITPYVGISGEYYDNWLDQLLRTK